MSEVVNVHHKWESRFIPCSGAKGVQLVSEIVYSSDYYGWISPAFRENSRHESKRCLQIEVRCEAKVSAVGCISDNCSIELVAENCYRIIMGYKEPVQSFKLLANFHGFEEGIFPVMELTYYYSDLHGEKLQVADRYFIYAEFTRDYHLLQLH